MAKHKLICFLHLILQRAAKFFFINKLVTLHALKEHIVFDIPVFIFIPSADPVIKETLIKAFPCAKIAGGEPCSNRLNYDDYVDIITGKGGFMEKYAEDPFNQLTGYSFTYKKRKHKIFVKVLKSSFNDIRIGVYNETVLGKRET